MFDEDEDYAIDDYFPPYPTTVFDQFATVMFPSKRTELRVKNKDTLVSIFSERRRMEHEFILYGRLLDYINNYVFLYKFKGINNKGGATVACSFLDPPKAKLHDEYEQTERDFSKAHYKIAKLENHKLIYHGARNEG